MAVAAWGSVACDTSVDTSPRGDLILVKSMSVTRAVADDPSIFFIDAVLHNATQTTVNNFHDATLSAEATSAKFELGHNAGPGTLVGCQAPDPWDVRPGADQAVRFRVDF